MGAAVYRSTITHQDVRSRLSAAATDSHIMTTYAEASVVCGACGCVFTHYTLDSTNSFGSPDLDTRPAEMERSTMHAWIQRCPNCGYCSTDVTKFDARFRELTASMPYRSQLTDPRCPELTSTFICAAMLAEADGRESDAGRAYLHAAWTLDDKNEEELAHKWRGKAADVFMALFSDDKPFVQQPGVSELILTDCLRRVGRGAVALRVIEWALTRRYEIVVRKILKYQRVLINNGDVSRHLVQDALNEG